MNLPPLPLSTQDAAKASLLPELVDGEFSTIEDVAQVALMFAAFPSNALTGQSMVFSHVGFMQ